MTDRETYTKRIGAAICALRVKNGMTQSELAEKINYSDKAISKWERGESLPDAIVLKEISDLFGVGVDCLFEGEEAVYFPVKPELTKKSNDEFTLFGIPFHMSKAHLAITLLSVIAVWFVAVCAFVFLKLIIPGIGDNVWLSYVAAIPVSCIVMVVFNSIWGSKLVNKIWISLLIWTSLVFIFLLVLTVWNRNIWLIFLLGIPAEAAIPIWHWLEWMLRKNKQKQKK